MRETLDVIRSECEGSVPVVRTSARRHSERQRRIYCRDKETLSVIRSGGEKFMEELVKTVKRKS